MAVSYSTHASFMFITRHEEECLTSQQTKCENYVLSHNRPSDVLFVRDYTSARHIDLTIVRNHRLADRCRSVSTFLLVRKIYKCIQHIWINNRKNLNAYPEMKSKILNWFRSEQGFSNRGTHLLRGTRENFRGYVNNGMLLLSSIQLS